MVQIKSGAARSDLIKAYHSTRAERYYGFLARALAWADGFYGAKWSLRSFGTCLTLAFLYPLAAAMLAWIATGQAEVGTLTVFDSVDSRWSRLIGACLFLSGLLLSAPLFFVCLRCASLVSSRIQNSFVSITRQVNFAFLISWLFFAGLFALSAFGFVYFTIFIVVFSADTFAISSFVIGFFSFSIFIVIFGSVTGGPKGFLVGSTTALVLVSFVVFVAIYSLGFFTIFAVALGGVVLPGIGGMIGAAIVSFISYSGQLSLLLLFYVLLPVANALADWASVSLTRWFLRDALDHRYGAWALIGYLLLDFIAGLACLALLLAGLVGLLEFWSVWGTPPLDWRAYWQAAQADRSAGIALWVMCFTTLLPTLVHVAWGLALWLFDSPAATRTGVEEMRHWDNAAPEADQHALAMRVAGQLQTGRRVQRSRMGLILITLAALAVWFEVWTLTTGIQLALDALWPAGN
mmetsp:Transcript_23489/g.41342  ORF Transcript_23489/g.41342 Transcript_23489/m.41342 type:complete len:463 (+) Transcript_23489:745-2133(+)